MTNEEKLIKFLNNKFQKSETNKVFVCKHELGEIGLSEKEVVQTAMLLQDGDFIHIENRSVHNDLSISMSITLKSSCVHYFDNKKSKSKSSRREWVRTYLPITISILALLKSYDIDFILLGKQLLKLLLK